MCTSRAELTTAIWRKSAYSGAKDGSCVEVADRQYPGTVPIRDSKAAPQGPAITPPTTSWSTFVTAVAAPE
ncbi:DUF397 domain-containing protein [Streptomyces sp. UNOC14_S4]|uniref:DUF397 domain-containing protein n=1 Tax=Streptomyces sp. UNOC14_S4 TaxID=2872340 RepID=UPI001E598CCD|nr:DUF397 domain-containing protein [Streptomyces sp. UNOC14_S4]MCC3769673.1 DUF397 domain-containing protein [Streptomyces sp. UNOC14_S4]